MTLFKKKDGGKMIKTDWNKVSRGRILGIAFGITILVLLLGGFAGAETNTIANSSCPVCNSTQTEEWQLVISNSLGVAGRDPVGYKIGPSPAYSNIIRGMNWYPFDIYKKTLCGQLDHYSFYDDWGDEADWNNYFEPDPNGPYAYLINDVLPLRVEFPEMDPTESYYIIDPATGKIKLTDEWLDCDDGVNNCMAAEITPDENFYGNQWFPSYTNFWGDQETDKSPLLGSTLCTYGPWVWDETHGNRPEIHPSELYWWKKSDSNWMLMLLQDDSNRFDRSYDFSGSSPRPTWWHPWSENPRTGEFKIAFDLNLSPAERPYIFFVNEQTRRNVVTNEDPIAGQDSDDGWEHALEYNGKVVLKVNERQSDDQDVGVRFGEVCRNAENNRLQGYLVLTSKVGKGDRGNEGYQVLNVIGQEIPIRKRVTVTFQSVKVIGDPDRSADIAFDFWVNSQKRSYPLTGTQDFSLGVNTTLPSDLSFTKDIEFGNLNLRVLIQPPPIYHPNPHVYEEPTMLEEMPEVAYAYDRGNNFGAGTHTEKSTVDDGRFFEIKYTIKVEDIMGNWIANQSIIEKTIPPKASVRGKLIKDSLRRVEIGGRPQLVGDVQFQIVGSPNATPSDLAVSRVEHIIGTQRKALAYQPVQQAKGSKDMQVVVKNVSLFTGPKFEFTMKSGEMVKLASPAISLAPYITEETPSLSKADASAWAAMVKAVGGRPVTEPLPAQLMKVSQWQLEATPLYAAMRGGKVSPEEDSPLAEELNDVISKGEIPRMNKLFNSTQPFKVEWSFQATNLITGATVPVKVGRTTAPTEILVEMLPGKVPNGLIKITFPEKPVDSIYEVIVTANVTDTLGIKSEAQHRVWNYVLSSQADNKSVEEILTSAANLAGVSSTELVAASKLDGLSGNDQTMKDTKFRQARTLRLFTISASEDKRITLDELRSLVNGAKLFEEKAAPKKVVSAKATPENLDNRKTPTGGFSQILDRLKDIFGYLHKE